MIRVTQGHENGVGLEVFLKAYLCLPKSFKSRFVLYCDKQALKKTLDSCLPKYKFEDDRLSYYGSELQLKLIQSHSDKITSFAIHKALKNIHKDDVLLTLPSSKDQIITENGETTRGHTDLFRKIFPDANITMSFVSPSLNVALLTDHVALSEVESSVDGSYDKILEAIKDFRRIVPVEEVFIAGIDPHCGEGGLIGSADAAFEPIIYRLKKELTDFNVIGPCPGDTILFNAPKRERLYVFPSHDQGLGPFKLFNGLTGINLTLGLPFTRVSVDHGTAFDLFGKNQAGYQGMIYLLNEVSRWK